jgi:hypothetical protein
MAQRNCIIRHMRTTDLWHSATVLSGTWEKQIYGTAQLHYPAHGNNRFMAQRNSIVRHMAQLPFSEK